MDGNSATKYLLPDACPVSTLDPSGTCEGGVEIMKLIEGIREILVGHMKKSIL